jgi:hypothetical protein
MGHSLSLLDVPRALRTLFGTLAAVARNDFRWLAGQEHIVHEICCGVLSLLVHRAATPT